MTLETVLNEIKGLQDKVSATAKEVATSQSAELTEKVEKMKADLLAKQDAMGKLIQDSIDEQERIKNENKALQEQLGELKATQTKQAKRTASGSDPKGDWAKTVAGLFQAARKTNNRTLQVLENGKATQSVQNAISGIGSLSVPQLEDLVNCPEDDSCYTVGIPRRTGDNACIGIKVPKFTTKTSGFTTWDGASDKPKSEFGFDFDIINPSWIPSLVEDIDESCFRSDATLMDIIESQLMYMHNRAVDKAIAGFDAGFAGIDGNVSNVLAPVVVGDTILDRIRHAIFQLYSAGAVPANLVLKLNPLDVDNIMGVKGADGHYIAGTPFTCTSGGICLYGVPVRWCDVVPQGRFHIGDWVRATTIYDFQSFKIEQFYLDKDVRRNTLTLRAESQLALVLKCTDLLIADNL